MNSKEQVCFHVETFFLTTQLLSASAYYLLVSIFYLYLLSTSNLYLYQKKKKIKNKTKPYKGVYVI